ncbi:MAG: FIST N-terminal domain-containing protein, partial [Nannocystaceae bacterium]
MRVETFRHSLESGWSQELPRNLDSNQTLVLVFGAPEYREHPAALRELHEAFPTSHLLGCSTAGEILGNKIFDRSLVVAVACFEATELASTSATISATSESLAAGEKIARDLNRPDLRGIHVLSEGSKV